MRLPFRLAVVAAVTAGVLLGCVLNESVLLNLIQKLKMETIDAHQASIADQGVLIHNLSDTAAIRAQTELLGAISGHLRDSVLQTADRALDVLTSDLENHFAGYGAPLVASSAQDRWLISHRALLELRDQWAGYSQVPVVDSKSQMTAYPTHLYLGFTTQEFAGAIGYCSQPDNGDLQHKCRYTWLDRPNGQNGSSADLVLRYVNPQSWEPTVVILEDSNFTPTERPWFKLQVQVADEVQQGATDSSGLRRLWTEIYPFAGTDDYVLGVTRTAPLAYCGNYSCMEGVVGTDITLRTVSNACNSAWKTFQDRATQTFRYNITHANSVVFVISHVSRRFPEQRGLLIGASSEGALNEDSLTFAVNSPSLLVRSTAKALVARYGAWANANASLVSSQQGFTFSRQRAEEGDFRPCEYDKYSDGSEDCMEVGTLPLEMDEDMHWLVVLVSPMATFRAEGTQIAKDVQKQVDEMEIEIDRVETTALKFSIATTILAIVVGVVLGCCLGTSVSRPLERLGDSMKRLGELDFSRHPDDVDAEKGLSHIEDVRHLQEAFGNLSRGIETFARFVPEAVVKRIVRGEESARRLHVERRYVTIMFSDIKGFTTISESVDQKDLVFLITCYLSIMTRVIESFDGVVTEILGDGLMVLWNCGPDDTPDHQAKACAAALAMQQAMGPLNSELTSRGMPSLAIRVGIHTGSVLAGNIGSDRKLKFGCMGDPVNLASRLEGICKYYGSSIICSKQTQQDLPQSEGFVTRQLDLVQVMGRVEPVVIYEVLGKGDAEEAACSASNTSLTPASHGTQHTLESQASGRAHLKSPEQEAFAAVRQATLSLADCELLPPGEVSSRRKSKPPRTGSGFTPKSYLSTSGVTSKSTEAETPDERYAVHKLRMRARRYEEALEAFQRARFAEARGRLEALLAECPSDYAAQMLEKRCSERLASPTAAAGLSERALAAWTGVNVMDEKF
jgi:class 3 adenylate cyclase